MGVASGSFQPSIPDVCPTPMRTELQRCFNRISAQRPTADQLVQLFSTKQF
jgi:hypothetical protein